MSNRVSRRQAERWSQQDAQQQPPQPIATAAAPQPDYTAELEKLASLRDQGVITAEDFDAKKKQLLGI